MIQHNIDISSLMKYLKDDLKKPDPFNLQLYREFIHLQSLHDAIQQWYFLINIIFQRYL